MILKYSVSSIDSVILDKIDEIFFDYMAHKT